MSISPRGVESIDEIDNSMVFAFDSNGEIVGRSEGQSIHSLQASISGRSAVVPFGDRVSILTENSSNEFPIERESIVQSVANAPSSGAVTIWFNSGISNGRYVNRFASVSADGSLKTGSVPGMVFSSVYCGDRNFALVRESYIGSTGNPEDNYLYELDGSGFPTVRAEWKYPSYFSSITPTGACTSDGKKFVSLYIWEDAISSDGSGDLTLVQIDTETGVRSERPLDMSGHTWVTERSSLSIIGDRLYWITGDGEVMSSALEGSSGVERKWIIPEWHDRVRVSVEGDKVSFLDFGNSPFYAEFDLISGNQTLDAIELPWLNEIAGSDTLSGKTQYTVSDVDNI
ncbi:hypothetical protein [Rhodococcus sp. SMB37]|uniref:hypothetical protein n=1 Tax=Rhodococcus sp. SMB37 TaxID=2512213 RepID=UPI00104C0E6D|nr:hypothetical protein [Rhodococcus sp. SMB37]